MSEFIQNSTYFGVMISLFGYGIGMWMKKKWKFPVFHPLLIGIILVMIFLGCTGIEYQSYQASAKYLSYLLTPATISLAIPLYEEFEQLKKHYKAILAGILAGVLTSLISVLVLCVAFRLGHAEYVTLLPKSVTTAIGIGISEELGGYISITAAIIIITGVFGNIIAETVCKVFGITEPVAKGVGIGSASHAIGTTRAMEMGEIEGAMSSLSIVTAGIFTVIGASVFALFV